MAMTGHDASRSELICTRDRLFFFIELEVYYASRAIDATSPLRSIELLRFRRRDSSPRSEPRVSRRLYRHILPPIPSLPTSFNEQGCFRLAVTDALIMSLLRLTSPLHASRGALINDRMRLSRLDDAPAASPA